MAEECVPLKTLQKEETCSNTFVDGPSDDETTPELEDEKLNSSSVSSAKDVPFIRAVRRGSSSTSLFLKETKQKDVCVRETDRHKRNAFHYAITKPDTLKILLERYKTDPVLKLVLLQEDKDGETPIHRAASFGNAKSLEILYEHDNVLMKLRSNVMKCSVLHFAVNSCSLVAVQFVLNKDPEQTFMVDSMSRTPVHYAATLKHKDIITLLISKEADIKKMDANGQLPIHLAASKGLLNIVELLIKDDLDCIDSLDHTQQTPLIIAAKNGFPSVVLYLLSEQADYKLTDNQQFSAFDWAVKHGKSDVIEVFLNNDYWKEIITGSNLGPEKCLTALIERMPVTSLILLDKCITVKNTTKQLKIYKVQYDFFCLESGGEGGPTYEALSSMIASRREECLSHPLCAKYVNVKWRKRGWKYNLATIFVALLFHICLMIFTTHVRGQIIKHTEVHNMTGGKSMTRTFGARDAKRPNSESMMVFRVIMLFIMVGTMLKEVYQMMMQRCSYFFQIEHYVQWALSITVLLLLLPVDSKINKRQIASGSIAVLLSWATLIQFLRMLPVLGVYIVAVFKVFMTLIKILVVLFIFLLSFSSTFYVLLAEHDSYKTFGVSIVSTFVAMMSGPDYITQFVERGWYAHGMYHLKLIVLILFVLFMTIAVNNTLIGLAVGDTDEVMRCAKIEKLLHKALFIVHLEKTVNSLPGFHMTRDDYLVEFPERKKNVYEMCLDFVFYGGCNDILDRNDGITTEDQFEKLVESKVENLHSKLRLEFTEMFEKMAENHKEDVAMRKIVEEKIDNILEKLS